MYSVHVIEFVWKAVKNSNTAADLVFVAESLCWRNVGLSVYIRPRAFSWLAVHLHIYLSATFLRDLYHIKDMLYLL